ncbi:hypothetical protein [Lysobacter sp. CA199]|uniref:hypothetical protein n=1 Tax=Lysobacter sp. CA199 TaxID=3455608 RepID=UPI003F8D03E1
MARISRTRARIGIAIGLTCALLTAAIATAWGQERADDGDDATQGMQQRDVELHVEAVPGDLALGQAWNPPVPGEPYTTAMGRPVKIRGVASLSLAGKTLSVTVTSRQKKEPPSPPDQGCPAGTDKIDTGGAEIMSDQTRPQPPTTLQVPIRNSGTFETIYTPSVTGTHQILASAGAVSGKTEFDVVDPVAPCEPLSPKQIEQHAKQLVETTYQTVDLVDQRVQALPDSPAKDEFKKKLDELRKAIQAAQPRGQAPDWVKSIEPFNRLRSLHPRIREAAEPLGRELRDWQEKAKQSEQQSKQMLAKLEHGNLVCDQLDIVINALKFVDFTLGLVTTPKDLIKGWLMENVPTKLIGLVTGADKTPGYQQSIESAWKLGLTFTDQRTGFALPKLVNDAVGYLVNRVFDRYCQTFTGPVVAEMKGTVSKLGTPWWWFQIKANGVLILRYPKDATGASIALSGELIGNASSFKSKDDAIRVLFPKFANGTVYDQTRIEPLAGNALSDGDYSGWDPGSIMMDKGGTMVRSLAPAFFRIPVRGDLRGDRLRIELQPAVMDFKNKSTKVEQVTLSPLSPFPNVTVYELPYPGAFTIFNRAFNDGPVEFTVTRVGANKDVMQIKNKFTRQRDTNRTHGEFTVDVTACNPSCP